MVARAGAPRPLARPQEIACAANSTPIMMLATAIAGITTPGEPSL